MWCSNYFCGAPFISDLQSGVFYPPSIIFLFGSVSKAFNIYVLTHFLLGFVFVYRFVKKIDLSNLAALFAGTAYCFGGYILSSINTLNNLSTLIWLPAILWAVTTALKDKKKSGYFLTILFCCMSILAGEPQLFIMTGMMLFLYCIIYFPAQKSVRSIFKIPFAIFIVIFISLLITSVQLGPAFTDYALSVRQGGISYAEATKNSLSFETLKHLLVPLRFTYDYTANPESLNRLFSHKNGMSWLLSIYPGILIIPFACLGILLQYSQKKLLWLLVFTASIMLALGNNTPVYKLLYKTVSIFRYPEKFIFPGSFSLIILAAYGLDELLKKFHSKAVNYIIFTAAFILLFSDLYYNHRHLNPLVDAKQYEDIHPDLQPVIDDRDIFRIYVDQESFTKELLQGSIIKHHITWQNMLFPNIARLKNIDQVNGTTGLELRYQYIITELLLRPWEDKIDFLRMANVKYIVSANELNKIPGIEDKVEQINAHVYRLKDFLPRARIIGKLLPVKKGTIDELIKPDFNYTESAVTNAAAVQSYNSQMVRGVEQIRYINSNKIEIQTNIEKPGVLILAESAYPGWKVFVDGKEKQCLWLNLLFQGVEIDKGKHRVEFIYSPDKFGIYIFISCISVLLFLSAWLYCSFTGRRNIKHA